MVFRFLFALICLFVSCKQVAPESLDEQKDPYIYVLGIAQDAGYPQAGCEKDCCQRVYRNPENKRFVSSIALVDPVSNEYWIFDATPDFREQLKMISDHLGGNNLPQGIFLTHAHIGHYTGLMHLGREAMSAHLVSVYAMPKMQQFLYENGPWSQLVTLKNIQLETLQTTEKVVLNDRISVRPFLVPHRDEFSETVGFRIITAQSSAVFIPDIDKWDRWDQDVLEVVKENEIALLDATFFADGEIKGRPMSEIPHPFVEESMELFKGLSEVNKQKIYFTHFNHTNPLLIDQSEARNEVESAGFNVAEQGLIIDL